MLTRVYSAVAFCGPNKKSFSFPFYVKGTSFIFVIPHLNGLHLKSESTVHVQFFFFWHNLTALFLFFFSSPFFFVGYSLRQAARGGVGGSGLRRAGQEEGGARVR